MFSYRHDIRARDLSDRNLLPVGGVQVDVTMLSSYSLERHSLRPNSCGDAELEILRFVDEFRGQVTRMEGCGDQDLCLWCSA